MRSIYFLLLFLCLYQSTQGAALSFSSLDTSFENLFCSTEIVKQSAEKSSLEITFPNATSAWTISEPAKIEWKTENIGADKSIRFFLARDEMVVQELGSFKNNFTAEGIKLAKNIGSGDTYQVVGIELFPDNKYSIAKFATPFFSIRNAAADARKAKSALANAGTPLKERTEIAERTVFEGRKISYIKELVFDSNEINISIWDHGRQDGDIVSIYLNGETVIAKHNLTYRKKNITLQLDKNKTNDLFLYAHNLGKAPPNTVSIEISDGSTSEAIVLNSDLKSCEAVLISVNK